MWEEDDERKRKMEFFIFWMKKKKIPKGIQKFAKEKQKKKNVWQQQLSLFSFFKSVWAAKLKKITDHTVKQSVGFSL